MSKNRYKKVIFILLDGIPFSVINNLLENNSLPNIKEHIVDRGEIKKVTSVFPSVTGPAFLPFLTGLFPGTANVPGIRWLSKNNYDKHKFSRPGLCSYMGPSGTNFNQDIAKTKTIFSYFKNPANIFNFITKDCPEKNDITKRWKLLHYLFSYFTKNWKHADMVAHKYLLKAVKKNHDFIFALFSGIDEYAHLYGRTSKQTIDEYKRIDKYIGSLASLLKKQKEYEDTLIIISSDHGMSDTHTHIDIPKILEEKGYPCLHYPKIWKTKSVCANMVSGNGMTHIYVKSEDNTWNKRIFTNKLEKMGYIKNINNLDGIDFTISMNKNSSISVISQDGHSQITENKEHKISYSVVSGKDPLGYKIKIENMSHQDVLEATYNTKYPDAPVQFLQIFESERTGDLLVNAKIGYDLRKRYEVHKHHATHGALNNEQLFVPFISNKKIDKKYARTVDIFPFILENTNNKIAHKINGSLK